MDFVYLPLIKLEESRFTKDFEGPYTNRNPQNCFEYSFENFTNLDKKKNGKVQNRTLPSSIEMSYKVKILRQTGVAPAHRGHIAILTLCNCY